MLPTLWTAFPPMAPILIVYKSSPSNPKTKSASSTIKQVEALALEGIVAKITKHLDLNILYSSKLDTRKKSRLLKQIRFSNEGGDANKQKKEKRTI
jgi:hypothetical protein